MLLSLTDKYKYKKLIKHHYPVYIDTELKVICVSYKQLNTYVKINDLCIYQHND